MSENIIPTVLAAVVSWLVWRRWRARSSLPKYIRGPSPESWILGSQAVLICSEAGSANKIWKDAFGDVYRMQSCYGIEWLMINDPIAMQHVLQGQTTTYHLEESLREFLRVVTGKGLVYADGSDHARQRRLLQPAFNTSFIRGLTPQFASCASRVVDQWRAIMADAKAQSDNGFVEINAFQWAERLAMEVIGQTAFGVRFGSIEGQTHELMDAYKNFISTVFSQPSKIEIALQALALQLPPSLLALADKLPLKPLRVLQHAKASSLKFSQQLIDEQRRYNLENPDEKSERKNILSVLAKAGEVDGKGKLRPMADEEIYAQLTTFFVAGYETSANTLTFALYELARDQSSQDKLYAELRDTLGHIPHSALAAGVHHSVFESMPYLAAVINETLRLHPAVAHGIFQAGKDDIIPLSQPIITAEGDTVRSIPIRQGQRIFLSFDGANHLESVWGPDADSFRPERWLKGGGKRSSDQRIRGPFSGLFNFGGGPKACPGWQYAVIELQTVVAYLLLHFQITLPKDYEMWRDGCFIVTTPTKKGRMDLGPHLPLLIKARE